MRRAISERRNSALAGPVRVAIFAVALGGVSILALLPGTRPPEVGGIGLIVHALVFGMLTLGAIRLFGRPWISAASILAFSALIEAAQASVPHRHASLLDIAANMAGVGLALAAMLAFGRWQRSRRRAGQAPTA